MEPPHDHLVQLGTDLVKTSPTQNGDTYVYTGNDYRILTAYVTELVYYVQVQYARCAEELSGPTPPTP